MTLNHRLVDIHKQIDAAKNHSPIAREVVIVGASKMQTRDAIVAAIDAGVKHFGENKVQEAAEKWPAIKANHADVELQLIGPLQTNKVKQAVELFDIIATLDRPKLADALAKEGKFSEAVHLILFRSIEDIQSRQKQRIPTALTAREIERLEGLPERPRNALRPIISLVERSFFGGHKLDAESWASARSAYEDFAFGEAWA